MGVIIIVIFSIATEAASFSTIFRISDFILFCKYGYVYSVLIPGCKYCARTINKTVPLYPMGGENSMELRAFETEDEVPK